MEAEEAINLEKGEINSDGEIDSIDESYMLEYVNGDEFENAEHRRRVDINEDGIIDENDMTAFYDKIRKVEESKLEGVEFYVKNSSSIQ